MKWLKQLFGIPTQSSDSGSSTAAGVGPSPANERIARVIADLKELDLQMKPLTKDTWPGQPQWKQLMTLANQKADRARTLPSADLPQIESYLQSQDEGTRRSAAYIIKVVHMHSPTVPVPTNLIALLGFLLRDSNDAVRDTALDTLHNVSKTTNISPAASDLVAVIAACDKKRRMDVIEALGRSGEKQGIVTKALQKLAADPSADIATAARQALEKLGVTPPQADETAAVQKLVWTWKSSGYGRFQTEAAHDELKKFPRPMTVCSVFTATLLKGDWASDSMAGAWPGDFCKMLGEIGDPRFLEDLFRLYRTFEANSAWKRWSGYFAVAILRIKGGWERMREEMNGNQAVDFIFKAITSPREADSVCDYDTQLTDEEKPQLINRILEAEKGNPYGLCYSLLRVGVASIETLLTFYRTCHPKEAAAAICKIPGAIDYLIPRLSTEEIETLIARRYEYAGSTWNESLVRGMGKLKTPRCVEWLNKEASAQYRDPAITAQRKALIEGLLAG